MWEAIASILKIFLEKYFIPTVISVIGGIITLLYLPDKYLWMTNKIGKVPFVILATGIIFLIVYLIIGIRNRINNYKTNLYLTRNANEQKIRDSEKDVDDFMTYLDGVSEEERELVIKLIKNNNTPIVQKSLRYNIARQSIYDTKMVVTTKNKDGSNLIKINPLIFSQIKEIYEKHGSISHF